MRGRRLVIGLVAFLAAIALGGRADAAPCDACNSECVLSSYFDSPACFATVGTCTSCEQGCGFGFPGGCWCSSWTCGGPGGPPIDYQTAGAHPLKGSVGPCLAAVFKRPDYRVVRVEISSARS